MSEGRPAPGSICHLEIPAPDTDAAKAFYGPLFGWTFQDFGPGYVMFSAGDSGGGFDPEAKPTTDGCVLVIAVEDIDEKLAEIGTAGGRTIKGKTEIPGGMGSFAYFADPAGNRLGIWMPG